MIREVAMAHRLVAADDVDAASATAPVPTV
jgi:hypothetical protein